MASAVLKFGRVIKKSGFISRLKTHSRHLYKKEGFHTSPKSLATTQICMPSLSPTMKEGTIVKWYKKEGEAINPGDILCDIQTDKAVVSFDMEEEGILAKILKPDNSTDLEVGTLIALMVEEGEDWQNVEVPADTSSSSDSNNDSTPTVTETAVSSISTATSNTQSLHAHGIGPSVRKLLEEYSINLSEVTGSGPHGRITKGDVLKYIKTKNLKKQELSTDAAPPPVPTVSQHSVPETAASSSTEYVQLIPDLEGEEFLDIPNTGMRTTIAKRLTLSKTTIPHSYVTMDCSVGAVSSLRKQLINDGVKVSVNDFIIKSAALALQRVPKVNSLWQNDNISPMSNVDICVAVATENGLITPIVKDAAFLGVDQISEKVKDLADRARQNKLQLQEFQGGTFTISNLGMFGISEFSAVINPPQSAIMAVGSSRVTLGPDGKPESQMTVTLSYDARVMDEGEASQFLEVFRDIIENPQLTLTGSSLAKRSSASLLD